MAQQETGVKKRSPRKNRINPDIDGTDFHDLKPGLYLLQSHVQKGASNGHSPRPFFPQTVHLVLERPNSLKKGDADWIGALLHIW